jgi:hypothetical protein
VARQVAGDPSRPPVSYAGQALSVVRRTPFVEFFGATTGFIVNYTPDHAVRFDLEGRPVDTIRTRGPKVIGPEASREGTT